MVACHHGRYDHGIAMLSSAEGVQMLCNDHRGHKEQHKIKMGS